MQYWLIKQEPAGYSWAQFAQDRKTEWTGVRNFQARKNLQSMRLGDKVLYYHSGTEGPEGTPLKAVVGVARVTREHRPDPTATDGAWISVELSAEKPLRNPVSLETIKNDPALAEIKLVRQSRLSVMPLAKSEFAHILQLGGIVRIKAGR